MITVQRNAKTEIISEKNKRHEREQLRWANMSPEQKEKNRTRQRRLNMTPTQKARIIERQRIWRANLTPEQKQKRNEKINQLHKLRRKNITPKQKEKNKIQVRMRLANMMPDMKHERKVIKNTRQRQDYAKKTIEERRQLYSNRTPAERILVNERARRWWAGLTPEQKARYLRRYYGYHPINRWFCGAHFHHTWDDPDDVGKGIHIPVELHKIYPHNHKRPETMMEINKIAYEFIEHQQHIESLKPFIDIDS